MMYLTWSAMSNQPDPNCKPDLAQLVFGNSSSAKTSTPEVNYSFYNTLPPFLLYWLALGTVKTFLMSTGFLDVLKKIAFSFL
jgi:hypothetical protein